MTTKLILEDIDQIMKSSAEDQAQIIKQLKNRSTNVKIDDQIILKDVIEIYKEFKNISEYQVELKPKGITTLPCLNR